MLFNECAKPFSLSRYVNLAADVTPEDDGDSDGEGKQTGNLYLPAGSSFFLMHTHFSLSPCLIPPTFAQRFVLCLRVSSSFTGYILLCPPFLANHAFVSVSDTTVLGTLVRAFRTLPACPAHCHARMKDRQY